MPGESRTAQCGVATKNAANVGDSPSPIVHEEKAGTAVMRSVMPPINCMAVLSTMNDLAYHNLWVRTNRILPWSPYHNFIRALFTCMFHIGAIWQLQCIAAAGSIIEYYAKLVAGCWVGGGAGLRWWEAFGCTHLLCPCILSRLQCRCSSRLEPPE